MTASATIAPTMEERESIFTENVYFRKILIEEFNALSQTVEESIQKIPQHGLWLRMSHFCDPDYLSKESGSVAHKLLGLDWDVNPKSRIRILRQMVWFHENPDHWPSFKEDLPDSVMVAWSDLISLAPEADRLQSSLDSVDLNLRVIATLPNDGPDTRELHGWYVHVSTGRRSATGWVVGGRGATLHIAGDPLSNLKGGDLDPFYKIAYQARHRAKFECEETIKFSRKTTHVELLLPPEVAAGRLQWMSQTSDAVRPLREEARDLVTRWKEWYEKASAIRERKRKIEDFASKIPASPTLKDLDRNGYIRYITGGETLFNFLFREFTPERVREILIEEFTRNNGGNLTEAEEELLAEEPIGGHDPVEALTAVLRASGKDLSPEF